MAMVQHEGDDRMRFVPVIPVFVILTGCGGDSTNGPVTSKASVTASVRQSSVVGGSECTGSCCSVDWTARNAPAGAVVTYAAQAGGGTRYTGTFVSDVAHHWSVSRADYVTVSWRVQRDSLDRTEGWSMACGASSTGSTATWEEP
jgi:hypothetical protein